jgi:15-cis-phytoene synthase
VTSAGVLAAAAADSAVRVLARHSRSFHWASALLSRQHAADAATLYAFCRHADDLVDELPPAAGRAAIVTLRAATVGPPATHASAAPPVLRDFRELMQRRGIDPAIVHILLRTLERDADPVRLASEEELLRYAYGVASTVGLMMCAVLGCDDARAEVFAIDLGIAMQLTNVARDVLEDARRDRIYAPMPAEVQPADIVADRGRAREQALTAVHAVLGLADRYYRSADRGMRLLPWRARGAIVAASRIYEGIGAVIRRRGSAYWQQRCHVTAGGKSWHTARALTALLLAPGYWRRGGVVTHDASLHRALAGLPGARP